VGADLVGILILIATLAQCLKQDDAQKQHHHAIVESGGE
jgi:hypothetical protein